MQKSTNQVTTIDQYISAFPEEIQQRLAQLREVIQATVPEAKEKISYQMPTFTLGGKNLVHFAAFKNHIGFFPFPSGVEQFKKETKEFATSKGTIQFPHDKPIPFDTVKKIVEFRVKENLANAK